MNTERRTNRNKLVAAILVALGIFACSTARAVEAPEQQWQREAAQKAQQVEGYRQKYAAARKFLEPRECQFIAHGRFAVIQCKQWVQPKDVPELLASVEVAHQVTLTPWARPFGNVSSPDIQCSFVDTASPYPEVIEDYQKGKR